MHIGRLEREQPLEQRQHRVGLLLGVQHPRQIESGAAVPRREFQALAEQALGLDEVLALEANRGEHA